MRSLFNKPEWASKTKEPQTDFYRRSGQTYHDIIAANEAAHRKVKASPETSEERKVEKDTNPKRLRSSEEPEDEDDEEDGKEEEEATNEDIIIADSAQPSEQIKGDGPNMQSSPQDQQNQPESPVSHKKKSPKLMRTSSSQAKSPTQPQLLPNHERPIHSSIPVDDEKKMKESPKHSPNADTRHQPSELSTPPMDDPIVQILITSEIPCTKSLIVHRKMSQGLKDVRVEWCRRQEIPTEAQNSVYLTWRRRRLFDVTTCKSLGIKPEAVTTDMEDDQGAEKGHLQIHMVACTENTDLLGRSSMSGSPSLPVTEDQQDQQNQQMKLILRSAGYDDFKIKARPKTLVSKLISAFRDKHSIGTDQNMWLLFDGDRLDPDTCLRDNDVDDLDMLEVQIKPQ
ncbi:hypothetical protein PENSTE_c037G09912 [Penicillium steckii]|uniref:Ubiquitin-like domain-containing protein n=1 Tax=Penicillium steckii TaxID=303698 RepID=A0A1V6SJY1_9EURO|nr:hypothetical protein PENSTE_c037G09912 [Penicillium steckii]